MTLDKLKSKLAPEFHPWIDSYGPALILMGVEGVKSWIELLTAGNTIAAYRQLLENMNNTALLDEFEAATVRWGALNTQNAAKIALQNSAVAGLLHIVLYLALPMFGTLHEGALTSGGSD